jgi:hypothetical protein
MMANRELVDRMRTCAAAMLAAIAEGELSLLQRDAADLLVEASNLLLEPEPLGEPMEILSSVPAPSQLDRSIGAGAWIGINLPTAPVNYGVHTPRPCPSCGSIDARKVQRTRHKLLLTCPRCSHQWEYGDHG